MRAKELKAGNRFRCYDKEYVFSGLMNGEDLVCVYVGEIEPCVRLVWGGHAVALIEEPAKPTYSQRQTEWVEKHGLKVGDKVKVLRAAKSYEDGWGDLWDTCMGKFVGRECVVESIDGSVWLEMDGDGWYFPYFILEPVVAIDPGDGYRLLKDDEACENGDEFLNGAGCWLAVNSSVGRSAKGTAGGTAIAVRRKKEPTYRPYTAEEAVGVVGMVVVVKYESECAHVITSANGISMVQVGGLSIKRD